MQGLLEHQIPTSARSGLAELVMCAGASAEKRIVAATGQLDAKRHLADNAGRLMSMNIIQNLATMLDVVVF